MRSLFWVEPGRIGSLLDRIEDPDSATAETTRGTTVETTRGVTPSSTSPQPAPVPGDVHVDTTTHDAPASSESSAIDVSAPEDRAKSIEDRLHAVITRLQTETDADGVFIADGDGLLVVAHEISADVAAASSALTEAWASVREPLAAATDSFVSMELDNGRFLHLLHVVTELGPFCLGLVAARAPGRSDANSIVGALRSALDDRREEEE